VHDLQREKLGRRNPKTIESQTPLPPATGHHGRRRREGERPAVRSGRRFKKKTTWVKSPQGQNRAGARVWREGGGGGHAHRVVSC
jgi:hypothetical protein